VKLELRAVLEELVIRN